MTESKIFKVLNADYGKIEDQTPAPKNIQIDEALIPYPRNRRGRMTVDAEELVLTENGPAMTQNFPDLLRMGLKFDAFTSYTETPTTWERLARTETSNKMQEEYLKDAAIGLLPIVNEGQPYPEAAPTLNSGVIIRNFKRGMIVSITEEMQKFDQVGKVRQLGELMGRAARLGEEQDVMNAITTTTNYTRTFALGDTDESATGGGANTQTLTFSAFNLLTAYNILRTMKDRRTGVYLNVMPNTLIVAPKLWWAAQQLIQSPDTMRQHGVATAEVYGTGTRNSFFNMVDTIIVSPQFGNGYEWALCERQRGLRFQRVEPMQILFDGAQATNESYLTRDVLRYRVRNWYGVGFDDDRYWFFSNSTPAPAVS